MTTSITSKNSKKSFWLKAAKFVGIFVFWIALWQIAAQIINQEMLLPTPLAVVEALIFEAATREFWQAVANSLLRVVIGFASAVTVGAALGVATAKIPFLRSLFSPILQIVKAAPVASFIILAYVWIKSDNLPIFIAFLTGLPMIWQTVHIAVLNPDKQLEEAADVFGIRGAKRLFKVTVYSAIPAFVSSAITCLGFCWKSVVATEVISPPLQAALGKSLYNAKTTIETPDVFAYTAVTVLLSMLSEMLLKTAVKRFEERQGKKNAY